MPETGTAQAVPVFVLHYIGADKNPLAALLRDELQSNQMEAFEEKMRRGGGAALAEMSRFFMGDDKVHRSLDRITSKLGELGIPYAVVGGMALNAHGYTRATVDVDILVTSEGLSAIHAALEGLGYVPPFTGSKHLRDVETTVRIEFLITGQFPGDGKPKPVAFPDPAKTAIDINGIKYLTLPKMIELKLASGMTNSARLKDLSDVQEVIKALALPLEFGSQLHDFVRPKFEELWRGVEEGPKVHE